MDPHNDTVVLHPLAGQILKHYRIESPIGQGGMGVVYRATDLKLQREVALKLLATGLVADSDRRKRFLLEGRAAARIVHPAIAQVYDVDEHEGAIFIAMELVEGKTVRELIDHKELDLLGAVDIAAQAAGGLAKAHDMGIIHRDIKPANVMVTPDGHVKILDFGVAKLLAPITTTSTGAPDLSTFTQTQIGAIKGTPAYMSPEQIRGESVDHRTDIFSLGALLFEMVTFQPPFRRASMMETMHAVAFEETPSLHVLRPNVPGELQRVVSRCLRKAVEERYPDAKALAEELRALRRGGAEASRTQGISLREQFRDAVFMLTHMRTSQYVWLFSGLVALGGVTFLLSLGMGTGWLLFFVIFGLYLYRYLKNQPQQLRELFVSKLSRIPEVRFITFQNGHFIVAVDRPSSQLYRRFNEQLNYCNRKLFFGKPLTLIIRHEVPPAELQRLLNESGILHIRDDVTTISAQTVTR